MNTKRGGYDPEDLIALRERRGYQLYALFWEPFTQRPYRQIREMAYSYFALPEELSLHDVVPDWLYLRRLMQHARRLDPGFVP